MPPLVFGWAGLFMPPPLSYLHPILLGLPILRRIGSVKNKGLAKPRHATAKWVAEESMTQNPTEGMP